MAASGQLQEFRDRDKLVFKREQVDLLGGGEPGAEIPLADSGDPIGLADDRTGSGSGPGIAESAKERSGISIFESDDTENSDPSAQTQVTSSVGGMPAVQLDPGASGSGLLDLTQTSDDTSVGANLLQDVYKGGDAGGSGAAPALFEPAGVASDVGAAAMAGAGGGAGMMMVAAEPWDGAGSGLAGGLALGMIVISALLLLIVLMAMVGSNAMGLLPLLAGNLMMYVGILAGVVLVFGLVGWAIGRKS
jgi:hypothetical protein